MKQRNTEQKQKTLGDLLAIAKNRGLDPNWPVRVAESRRRKEQADLLSAMETVLPILKAVDSDGSYGIADAIATIEGGVERAKARNAAAAKDAV